MHNRIGYQNIERLLLAKFPDLKGPLEKKFASYYNLNTESPGAYPVFEDVFREFLFDLLDFGGDDPLLPPLFSFVEDMAESQDKEVVNLLWIALLEPLVFQRTRVRRAWKYMGQQTKELARQTARAGGWLENLPAD